MGNKTMHGMFSAIVKPAVMLAFVLVFTALAYFFHLYAWYALAGLNDFGKFLNTARALYTHSPDPYAPGPHTLVEINDAMIHFLDMNPPQFHLFLYPLVSLSDESAAFIWLLVQFTALFAGLYIIERDLKLESLKLRTRIGLLFLVLLATPTLAVLLTGQFTFVLFFLVTTAWHAMRKGLWTRGGAILGICCSVKPFFLIFLPWLLIRRKWNAAAAFSGATAAMYGAAYIIHGRQAFVSWLNALHAINWRWVPMNASLAGFLDRIFGQTILFVPIVDKIMYIKPLEYILSTLIAIAAFTRIIKTRTSVDLDMALLLATAQLIQPLGHIYYIWLIAAPLTPIAMEWLQSARNREMTNAKLILLYTALFGFMSPIGLSRCFTAHSIVTLTVGSIFFWALSALWLSLMLYEPPLRTVNQA